MGVSFHSTGCAKFPEERWEEICTINRTPRRATSAQEKTRKGKGRMGIDCPNEDHRPAICFRVGRMRWRSAESIDKMRRSLSSFIESICNTRPSRSSNGNGSK
jgi:hypothetical protein